MPIYLLSRPLFPHTSNTAGIYWNLNVMALAVISESQGNVLSLASEDLEDLIFMCHGPVFLAVLLKISFKDLPTAYRIFAAAIDMISLDDPDAYGPRLKRCWVVNEPRDGSSSPTADNSLH
jgi:hypothetical protein